MYNKLFLSIFINIMKFLFDLGGVFFDWDPNHFYKDFLTTKVRIIFLKIFVMMNGIKQDKGDY